ncbi:MAG: FAD-dependent oxidoreductase [Bacteroidales bacterium]|nr:FAD-dependent oxidoreductase [Bacteroidales bacterium]
MRRISIIMFFCSFLVSCNMHDKEYDICIYGGTSAGVIAARTAALQGHSVIIVEPLDHIGGMTTGGLGQTDIGNKQVVEGLSRKFYRDLGTYYGSLEKWVFEPSVAKSVFNRYLDDARISVLRKTGLFSVEKEGTVIRSLYVKKLDEKWNFTGSAIRINAKMFIDASYEGDLMAAAGVSCTVGRESAAKYGESWNGRHLSLKHQFPDGIDPYIVQGDPSSGLLPVLSTNASWAEGDGDSLVQAYNFRICLTDSLQNLIPLERPARYDSTCYELMSRLLAVQGDSSRYFIWDLMPNRKTDINNFGGFSSDLIGGSNEWPEACYRRRKEIWQEHYDYTLGLLWFMKTDSRVPESIRSEMSRWGLPKDEYPSSGHWTPQLYVREGRRMVSDYVITQSDCEGRTFVEDGVALAAYTMDSHNCRRIVVDGMVKNEGNVETKIPGPYPIPYRSIIPKRKECTNLLVPVCLSASHIAFGSVRMEPVFMTLGQIAAMAADMAISQNSDVQDVSAADIRAVMRKNPYLDGSSPDILLDDLSDDVMAPNWVQVRKNRGYGPTYLELPVSSIAAPAIFKAEIPEPGLYAVYSYTNLKDKLSSLAHYRIENAGREYRSTVDASNIPLVGQTKGDWAQLGEYDFEAGQVTIEVNRVKRDLPLRADAILILRCK